MNQDLKNLLTHGAIILTASTAISVIQSSIDGEKEQVVQIALINQKLDSMSSKLDESKLRQNEIQDALINHKIEIAKIKSKIEQSERQQKEKG